MTKEQAEEAAQALDHPMCACDNDGCREYRLKLKRAVHALRTYWPMRTALETSEFARDVRGFGPCCPECGAGDSRNDPSSRHAADCSIGSALALARKEP